MSLNTNQSIEWIINQLKKDQSPNGSWTYPFESGLSTDAHTIILLRSLKINDENLIHGLASRIISKQQNNGSWKIFHDEKDGNLSATIEAYNSLLYSGYLKKTDTRLEAAKKFILAHGGIENTNFFTRIMLAITGQHKWPTSFFIPIETILLPPTSPINFYNLSIFGRANLAPLLILAEKKFNIKISQTPDLSDLFSNRSKVDNWTSSVEWLSFLSSIEEEIKNLTTLPDKLHASAIDYAQKYMLDRIEPDGTLYSYYPSTLLMIYALLSLGYSKNDPVIQNAISGIKSMTTIIEGFPHIQFTTANVWNTALISTALQSANIHPTDPVVKKANHYLLKHQHKKTGDWALHKPEISPGGWGFSNINTLNPDIDDTTASLRAITREATTAQQFRKAWSLGTNWLLSMQNDDGGWAAFEKNIKNDWLELLPYKGSEFIFGDSTTADLTGRTLEFLGNYTNIPKSHPKLTAAIHWLIKNQEKNGSWYGRWGICYIYGTWAAITGMISVELPRNHPSIQQAVNWLNRIQNTDGGWGESCLSDNHRKYVPLNTSTLTDTAWALDALIIASSKPTEEIQKGIQYLLHALGKNDWTSNYPKGQGIPGNYYIHYHSYRYIFPLLALSHYQEKFT